MEKTIYVVQETESVCPEYKYEETCDTLEQAKARMKELYHENAVNVADECVKGEIAELSAMVEYITGTVVEWNIIERQVQI